MTKNNTVAVVVTYNRLELLKQCIDCLKKQTTNLDILVIDNASNDGTREWLEKRTDVIYENTGSNLGGAGGFSYGIKKACKLGYEYLWIMDDDCLAKEDALEKFKDTDKKLKGNYGWLSSIVLWTDGKLCPMNIQRKTPFGQEIKECDKNEEVVLASFVSLFLKRETVLKYGLPFKEFFIWSDDWEYTRRISRQEKCYVVSDSKVIHVMKNKTIVNIATDTEDRLHRYQYFYRNDVCLYRREGIQGWFWLITKYLYHSVQVLSKGEFSRLSIIWKGFVRGCKFHPEIEYIVD